MNKLIFIIERVKALRGALLLVFVLSFLSCDGQITVDENGNFNFPTETITVHDTILRDYTDLEIVDVVNQYTLADTITRNSDVFYLDYKDNLQPLREYYIYIQGEGLVNVTADSTKIDYTIKERSFKRLKTFGETFYELIE